MQTAKARRWKTLEACLLARESCDLWSLSFLGPHQVTSIRGGHLAEPLLDRGWIVDASPRTPGGPSTPELGVAEGGATWEKLESAMR